MRIKLQKWSKKLVSTTILRNSHFRKWHPMNIINLDLRLWGFAYKHAFFFALDVLQKQLKNLKTEEERRGRLEKILGWERLNPFLKGLQETILLRWPILNLTEMISFLPFNSNIFKITDPLYSIPFYKMNEQYDVCTIIMIIIIS